MDKSSNTIQTMFNSIADRYDFNNNFISLGLHKIIKYKCIKMLNLDKTPFILDLCTGTGDVARLLQLVYPKSKIIAVDFSQEMLKIARKKSKHITFLEENCLNLPFDEESFDCCTMSFGLRNIEDKNKSLNEIHRVLKEDGLFLHLDFGAGNKVVDFVFEVLTKFLKKFYKNSKPYQYLIESKQAFEHPNKLIEMFYDHGFRLWKKKEFLFGIIAVQIMIKN